MDSLPNARKHSCNITQATVLNRCPQLRSELTKSKLVPVIVMVGEMIFYPRDVCYN